GGVWGGRRGERGYADELARISGTQTAILTDGLLSASTLPDKAAREFESRAAGRPVDGTVSLDGESHAFRRLIAIGDTAVYALSSIDGSSRAALRSATTSLAGLAGAALILALVASLALARQLTEPIDRLSTSLAMMAA